ncbi:hypothetical protein [Halobacteriovorax marinus]|uniref:hypothetical protein n=1 Tax=Halobacteriovorax marinus TaxID=97084 RepID=UPI003A936F60
MKKTLLALSIALISTSNILACESVDQKINEYRVGLASQIDVAKAVDCNLNKELSKKSMCNTKIGLKQDLYDYAKRSYEYGMTTQEELFQAKEELNLVKEICN